MEIKYLGHASFLINTKTTPAGGQAASVIIDPFDPKLVGFPFPKVSADLVLVSHAHPDHNNTAAVSGNPFIISGPGEYEVKGIKVDGLSSYHDNEQGKQRGKNTVYLIRAEGLSLLHCGDLGHLPPENQLEHLGDVHILLIPVGGFYTIGPAAAVELVAQVEPKIVIPMHYRTEKHGAGFKELAGVDAFLKEMGGTPRYEKTLKVKRETLPEETQVVVLS